jgi:hypothetical protein
MSQLTVEQTERAKRHERAVHKLRGLINTRRARALDEEALRSMAEIWPPEEKLDEFLTALEVWRSQKPSREIP